MLTNLLRSNSWKVLGRCLLSELDGQSQPLKMAGNISLKKNGVDSKPVFIDSVNS